METMTWKRLILGLLVVLAGVAVVVGVLSSCGADESRPRSTTASTGGG
jgi:hypothetical protein